MAQTIEAKVAERSGGSTGCEGFMEVEDRTGVSAGQNRSGKI
jgi:hypothetical protein